MTRRPSSPRARWAVAMVPFAIACASAGAAGAGTPGSTPPAGAPAASTEALALNFSNRSSSAVNVSVMIGGVDIFLRQVSPNSSEHIPVRGVAAGAMVTLRAVSLDGLRIYSRDNVILDGAYTWQIP
jgi:hypothetical protein